MSEGNQINSVKDACKFIRDWYSIQDPLPGAPLPQTHLWPQPIIDLNDELGKIWTSDAHPLKITEPPFATANLFNIQDKIYNPHGTNLKNEDANEIICFASENQGVWSVGFTPSSPQYLWYISDLTNEKWEQYDVTLDDGLISILLTNFQLMTGVAQEFIRDQTEKEASHILYESIFPDEYVIRTNDKNSITTFYDWISFRDFTNYPNQYVLDFTEIWANATPLSTIEIFSQATPRITDLPLRSEDRRNNSQ